MSKKYTESMNKITVDDKLKKRILQKVSEAREEEHNNITSINRSRYNKVWTKSVGLVAACCAFVVCTSLNSKFPELFNKGNVNLSNENVENDNFEIDNETVSEDSNESESNINSEGIKTNNEDAGTDNVSKEENNNINNTGKETRSTVADNHVREHNISNNQDNYSGNNRAEADLNNDVQEHSNSGNSEVQAVEEHNYNSGNAEAAVLENHNYDNGSYETASSDYLVNNDGIDTAGEKDNQTGIGMKSREMPGNMIEEFEIPEAIKNDAEITYTLLVSDDVMEVGYKNEDSNGVLRISSHKIDDADSKDYPKTEILKTDSCEAVLMSNEDNTKRIAEWEFNHKFYSLNTDENADNEEIIRIIESSR